MGRTILRLTTRCRDVDEFVTAFARQIDKDSLVVKAENPAAVGVKPAFAIALADGTFVMRGRCDVGPLARGMIRLRFLSLDDAGQAVRDRILGREPEPALPHEPLLTVRMAPLFPDDVEPEAPAQLAPVEVDMFVEEDAVAAPPPVPRPSEPAVFARPDTIRPVSVEGPAAAHSHIDVPRPFVPATHKVRALWRDEDRARVLVLVGAAAIALSVTLAGAIRGDEPGTATATATATATDTDTDTDTATATDTATVDRRPLPSTATVDRYRRPLPSTATVTDTATAPATAPAAVDDVAIDLAALPDEPTCHLVVRARPAGATVTLGDLDLGPSPIAADVPCGTATLTIAHAGYKTVRKKIKLSPTTAKVRLRRP